MGLIRNILFIICFKQSVCVFTFPRTISKTDNAQIPTQVKCELFSFKPSKRWLTIRQITEKSITKVRIRRVSMSLL